MIKPYNGSIFQLKGTYKKIFPELCENDGDQKTEGQRFYKIRYTLNMLPSVTYKDGESLNFNDFMEEMGNTDELDIFRTKVVNDFFDQQWETYAKHLHYFGALVHFAYITLFTIYIIQVYNHRNFENRIGLCWGLLVCLIYPMVYDGLQLIKQGLGEYFSDKWNFLDQGHIWIGIANVFIQRTTGDLLSIES